MTEPTYDTENRRHNRIMSALGAYILETQDHDLYGGLKSMSVWERVRLKCQCAADWADGTKIKPSVMQRWWKAGCFEPEAAQSLIELGIGPKLAGKPCGEVCGEFETFAYQVSIGKLTAEHAKKELCGV